MKINGQINRNMIVQTVSTIDAFAKKNGLDKKSRMQLTIALEEIMLFYMEKLGENTGFILTSKKKNGDLRTCLDITGGSFDVTSDKTPILDRLCDDMDAGLSWKYDKVCNHVDLVFPIFPTLRKNLSFTWKYMSGQRIVFFIAVISQLTGVVLSIIGPILSAKLIVAYTNAVFEQIILIGLAILGIRLLSNLVGFISNHSYNVVYNRTLSAIEEDMVDSALKITKSCIDEQGSGLFIQRLTIDTTKLATGFNTLADLITTVFRYFGILWAIAFIDCEVFFVVLALIIMQGVFERIRTVKLNIDDRIYRESNERFTGMVGEMIRGSTDVKILNSEESFKKELAQRITDSNEKRMKMQNRSWAYKLTRMELGAFILFGFIALLAYLISKGTLEPVMAIVLFNYYSTIDVDAIAALGEFLEFIKDFNLSSERVNLLIYGHQFPKERFGKEHLSSVSGEVSFDHVSFAYKDPDPRTKVKNVINDMSFVIPAGTTAAFVGMSGSGKSTTINLISKLYEVSKGFVRIDGIDIRSLDKETIRSNIAVVSQQPYIFNLSIRENFRLVKADITEDELIDVCKKTCIYEDIVAMPDGFDTIIGEAGINLSGGQRQRLAIARTLIRKYRILLLDEATSSLDNINQTNIQQTLENIHGEATIIIVAHRLSTIINADRIFFLDSGRILDSGTHEELLESCPQYRQLYGA